MKKYAILLLILTGCHDDPYENMQGVTPASIELAKRFNAPPAGWTIACDNNGHFCAGEPGGRINDWTSFLVRTSRFEAVIIAWQITEWRREAATEQPKPKFYNWHNCD